MGDAVQMSAVLRHVVKYRPHCRMYFQAEEGRHQIGRGICAATFAYGSISSPLHYDAEVQIRLYDKWWNFHDRPNTRVSSCLREHFDLNWDAECGRYQVEVSPEAERSAKYGVGTVWCKGQRAVAFHYRGDSAPEMKNLSHTQGADICDDILKLRYTPLLLDWRDEWPIASESGVRTVARDQWNQPCHVARRWGGDAEMNCAVIQQCAAFVGIDSGPAKCASATDTPSLVIWTGHHPAPFHDPATNTTHLVPVDYHDMHPVYGDQGVTKWFDDHYKVWYYNGDIVGRVKDWLKETIK